MSVQSIYEEIATRTGGDIYIGVTGPVRTGKSTFIKRFMEAIVLPNIENEFLKERTRDELPQSGSGKSIMTAEPKFVPEEAIEVSPDGTTKLSVRLIDSVGYVVEGAAGATENGNPRMVTTPWFPQELPLSEAAEVGTKKVMESHCTVGVLITTDGTVTDLPRSCYEEAEARAIADMQKTGKPFVVLVNSAQPESEAAAALVKKLREMWNVTCLAVNCLTMQETELQQVLNALLQDFPVSEIRFFYPRWLEALEFEHPLKNALYMAIRESCEKMHKLSDASACLAKIGALEQVENESIRTIDTGTGTVDCALSFADTLFYEILGEQSGLQIDDDGDLMRHLKEYAAMKAAYERFASAAEEAEAAGYGIVPPMTDQLKLEQPQVIRRGNTYGIRLRASAPSIHMIRTDVKTEICPMVGNEAQSQELVTRLLDAYDTDVDALWQSNIFGKSVFELVNDGLSSKLVKLPADARSKLKDALTKIVNDGCNGMICLII